MPAAITNQPSELPAFIITGAVMLAERAQTWSSKLFHPSSYRDGEYVICRSRMACHSLVLP
jgi:hypothetical protein